MATAAVIGAALAVEGYALAGAAVHPAATPAEAAAAWDALPADTGLLIVTASAVRWLADRLAERPELLIAVMQG